MKFIKTIELNNFQSHKYSKLQLDPYLNVIVGPSDSGKSSIIRAIKWVLFNEPSGDFFIREGESESSVVLSLSDGSKVTRFRSKSKNSYIINYSNGEELILNGFGLNVPEEVEDLTGVSKVPFDQDTKEIINIADQLEGPFLLSEKNSTKAFVIGGLAGVDVVDDSISELLKELRNLNIEDKRLDESIDKIDKDLEQFEKLDDLKNIFTKTKMIYDEINQKNENLAKLTKLLESYDKIKEEEKKVKKTLENLKNLDIINKLYLSLFEDISKHSKYTSLNSKVEYLSKEIKDTKDLSDRFKYIDKTTEIKDAIDKATSLYSNLYKNNMAYREILREKKSINLYINKLKHIDNLKTINNEILVEVTKYKSLCNYNIRYKDIRDRQVIGNKYIKHFTDLNAVLNKEEILDRLIQSHKNLDHINKRNNNILMEKSKVLKTSKEYSTIIADKSKKYKDILLEARVCPTCFSSIDDEIANNIVEEFNK